MEEQNSKHISQKCFPVAQTVEHGEQRQGHGCDFQRKQ